MDDRTTMLTLMALLLVGGVASLGALYYLLRPKKKATAAKAKPASVATPAKVVGKVKLTKRERMSQSLDTLEVAARWSKTLYGPRGEPTTGSYVALFRDKGEKHQKAITAQVKAWLKEG